MAAALSDYKVLTLDCYGTLIDWESGIWDALQPLLAQNARAHVTREMALASFSELENQIESASSDMLYPKVLSSVHAAIASHFELDTTPELDLAFGGSVGRWPAFADTFDALRYLKTRYKLVILSNVDRDSFAASNVKLGVGFDAIYTAEDIGSYKPNPANFEYLLRRLREEFGLEPSDVLHTAQSLFHDHAPAKTFDLANAWIDRQRLSEGGSWGATAKLESRPETDFVFHTMGEMADAVREEIGD
ncbi:MAG: haloacid dehalogenase type II [Acidobacteriota bacterium]|nr:MAG: haloacid dehalogenase type II [Acidobacteriota bacterium]